MKKSIEQLTNVDIDYLSAKALGYDAFVRTSKSRTYPHVWVKHKGIFSPTTNPKDTLILQTHAKIGITPPLDDDIYWTAYIKRDKSLRPSERRDILAKKRSFSLEDAICRCFVAFIYGATADVEEIELNEKEKVN